MHAKVFIVRIYSGNTEAEPAGTVEIVRTGKRRPFRSLEQLRAILAGSVSHRSSLRAANGTAASRNPHLFGKERKT
jgi:hypothetical protein